MSAQFQAAKLRERSPDHDERQREIDEDWAENMHRRNLDKETAACGIAADPERATPNACAVIAWVEKKWGVITP